jgi:hypothetical protein
MWVHRVTAAAWLAGPLLVASETAISAYGFVVKRGSRSGPLHRLDITTLGLLDFLIVARRIIIICRI